MRLGLSLTTRADEKRDGDGVHVLDRGQAAVLRGERSELVLPGRYGQGRDIYSPPSSGRTLDFQEINLFLFFFLKLGVLNSVQRCWLFVLFAAA